MTAAGVTRAASPWPWAARRCALAAAAALAGTIAPAHASPADDQKALVALDIRYQRAVEENDARTMGEILADDFVLVEGDGKRSTKGDLLAEARGGRTHYRVQRDTDRTVVVSGDTAVLTARLTAQGIEDGAAVDYQLWFSDVYVRTPTGWRYFFGQASLPLPAPPHH
jgi:ketosteroid isomerase-like protein